MNYPGTMAYFGLPGGSVVKNPPASVETQEMWVPSLGWGRSPGGGSRSPLQYSCLENPMNRGGWRATWGCKDSDTTEHTHIVNSL